MDNFSLEICKEYLIRNNNIISITHYYICAQV
jgi:hypothetical protein